MPPAPSLTVQLFCVFLCFAAYLVISLYIGRFHCEFGCFVANIQNTTCIGLFRCILLITLRTAEAGGVGASKKTGMERQAVLAGLFV